MERARERGGRIPAPSPGLRYMAVGAFAFSVMGLLVKVAGQRLPSQEVVLGRAIVSLAMSWYVLRRRRIRVRGNAPRLLLLRGLFGFGALSCFFYSITRIPLADATVLHFSNPIFATILSAWLLGEPVGRRQAACLVASLVGVVLVAKPAFLFGGEALDPLAVAIGLAGALLSATAYVLVRKLGESEDAMVIVFYFALVSVLGSIPLTAVNAVVPTAMELLVVLGVGIATQVGQVSITRGLLLEPAGRATSMGYLQIVFAAVWGVVFFGEIPDLAGVTGAALIVGSTLALALMRARHPGPPAGTHGAVRA